MKKHPELTRKRLENFVPELERLVYPSRAALKMSVYAAPDRIPYAEALTGEYRALRLRERLGPLWSTHWVRLEITIPPAWKGQWVYLLWDSTSEALVWYKGVPIQGLMGSSPTSKRKALRPEFPLTCRAEGGEQLELYIEVACNGLFGAVDDMENDAMGTIRQAEIAIFDPEAWELLWDFTVIADMARQLPLNSPRGGQALYVANEMINAVRVEDRTTWPRARAIAAQFFNARNGDGQHNLAAIGHAHIDTAWLWPIAETPRKCARTFASSLKLMVEYPEYKFACSQAQQYAWVKQLYPELYERIKARVKEGRFIPVGGTWIEPDCNIPSGESLARQFLFGQNFFRQEFGITCREFWNPDVFGYNGALPQLMREAEISFFLTQKLSWNQFNPPPHHTFLWEGIDGSRILTHFPPADTYNSMANVQEVLFNVSNFKEHDRANESYLLFGYGDGGGGPTRGMLEQLKRMHDVDGLPRVEIRSPQEFFARCQADARDLPVWVGELYFELHRGTYTSQALTKRNNRRVEFLLHDIEFLASVAAALGCQPYPAEELAGLWRRVLTNQFHDIIPGSSINQVYKDAGLEYEFVLNQGAALRRQALKVLLPETDQGGRVAVVNTLSFARREVVELPEGVAAPPGGRAQTASNGRMLAIVSAPPYGYGVAEPEYEAQYPARVSEVDHRLVLENERVRATFDHLGALVSMYDFDAERECIAPQGRGNQFLLFDDHPTAWEAWDVDIFHLEKFDPVPGATNLRVLERGPLRVAVQFEYCLSDHSTLVQVVSLTALSARLDFDTRVDWHEARRFLKVEFPLDVRSSEATYEIQFGHLKRPTHFNTRWDLAKFEVCAHKWADLSEPDFGVALLNNSKYGYAVHGNVMRLSLLRAPQHPDPRADQGTHHFRYALLPHRGAVQEADVIEQGYALNSPPLLLRTGAEPGVRSFFQLSSRAVILETVKKAEQSNALVLRLYEAHGTRGTVQLTSALKVREARRCNLLEDDKQVLEWKDGGVDLYFTPFQIMTLKLVLE